MHVCIYQPLMQSVLQGVDRLPHLESCEASTPLTTVLFMYRGICVVYAYMCTDMCVYKYIYIYFYIFMYIYEYICVHMHIFISR